MRNADNHFPLRDRLSFLWLAIGTGILLFANGLAIVPVAAWIGPVFMVRFLRTQKAWLGLLVGYLANAIVFYVQWNAAFQDAGAMFTLYTAAFGLLVYVPYVVDRLLAPHVRGFARTLILPTAWVVMEYVLHIVLPLGTFFNVGYTQSANLPLLQIISVTGVWSISLGCRGRRLCLGGRLRLPRGRERRRRMRRGSPRRHGIRRPSARPWTTCRLHGAGGNPHDQRGR